MKKVLRKGLQGSMEEITPVTASMGLQERLLQFTKKYGKSSSSELPTLTTKELQGTRSSQTVYSAASMTGSEHTRER